MPCDTYTPQGMTLQQRGEQIDAALKDLERRLSTGDVRVALSRQGAIAFQGWSGEARGGISDVCAYRLLAVKNSPELRRAVARAESQQQVKLNPMAIASGEHSHDGGKTWGRD